MPAYDDPTPLVTSGKQNVIYVDGQRRSRNAIVMGDGTSSGLKLRVPSLHRTIDNVQPGTERATNCYVAR